VRRASHGLYILEFGERFGLFDVAIEGGAGDPKGGTNFWNRMTLGSSHPPRQGHFSVRFERIAGRPPTLPLAPSRGSPCICALADEISLKFCQGSYEMKDELASFQWPCQSVPLN
jgi:hypothetical protein